jgi:hypothetical protein
LRRSCHRFSFIRPRADTSPSRLRAGDTRTAVTSLDDAGNGSRRACLRHRSAYHASRQSVGQPDVFVRLAARKREGAKVQRRRVSSGRQEDRSFRRVSVADVRRRLKSNPPSCQIPARGLYGHSCAIHRTEVLCLRLFALGSCVGLYGSNVCGTSQSNLQVFDLLARGH